MTHHAATTKTSTNLVAATMAVLMAVAGTSRAAAGPIESMAAAESKMVAGKGSYADGYARTGSSKGDKGYAEDDVYGDKDGDSYGFGTQTSFGTGDKGIGGVGAYHESASYDDRDKPKFSAWHFEDKDGRPTKRYVFDSHNDGNKKKHRGDQPSAEASEYDSVEAYDDDADDGGGNTHAGYETEEADPEYGALYDSADVYSDADAYY